MNSIGILKSSVRLKAMYYFLCKAGAFVEAIKMKISLHLDALEVP